MVISKEKIEISTLNAIIALVIGIGSIVAVFFNTKADLVEAQSDLTGRVIKLETIVPEVNRRLENIEGAMNTINSAVLQVVNKR